jgi:superfamily II DNA or RNA helicase
MALVVPRNLFDSEKEEITLSCLSFRPGEDKFKVVANQQPVEPIRFFEISKNQVILPSAFGRKLFKKEIEKNILKPPHHENIFFNFLKELFVHQQTVADRSYETLKNHNFVLLNLFTGFGKTIMGAYLSSKLQKRTLILSTQSILPKQWEETFLTFTDAKVEVYSGSKKKFPSDESQVVICTSGVLNNMPYEIRKTFGTVILDEVHSFCTRTRIFSVLLIEPTYIIAETATFERPDGGESMIRSVIGYNDVVVPLKKNFNVYCVETGVQPTVMLDFRGKMIWSKYVSSLVQNDYRNDLIVSWILKNSSRKILVLTDRKEMIDNISGRLLEKQIEHDFLFGNKKKYKDTKILLGTWAKIGVGFDEKSACENFSGIRIDLVFLLFSTKQTWLVEQSVGRAFRAEMPSVVDFVDQHPTSKSHFGFRQRWYKSRGGNIIKVSGEPIDTSI